MPQSLANVIVDLVFSTKNRVPTITNELRHELHSYLGGVLKNLACDPITVGGVENHVHLLFGLSRTVTIAQITEKLKTSSAKWAKERHSHLVWQTGYGAFSIGASDVKQAAGYIRNQETHHRQIDFQDEYRSLLREAGIAFDEKYLWD